jgi:glycosyltransferase involved in cell wall biosynthesis
LSGREGIELSIIIATLNPGPLLGRTLLSIEEQRGVEWSTVEVLVADGGSSDGSFEMARTSPIVSRAARDRDDGIYDGMNKGAEMAKGVWLQYLNAGDTYTGATALSTVLFNLRTAGNSLWVVGAARNMRGGKYSPIAIRNLPHVWWRHAVGIQSHCHQACFFRREVFSALGGHSQQYGTAGDFDFILRIGVAAGPPAEFPEVVVDYLGGGVSEQSSWKTARLLHAVRSDRLALGFIGNRADFLIGLLVAVLNFSRKFAGGARASLGIESSAVKSAREVRTDA